MNNKKKITFRRLYDYVFNFSLTINLFLIKLFEPDFRKKYKSNTEKDNMTLTFLDDFEGLEIDKNKWSHLMWWGQNYHPENKNEWYDINECILDNNSFLSMNIAKKQATFPEGTFNYAVGHLCNSFSFEQQYGYFEIRCKIPSGRGTWPAFWLGSKHSWPPEIDLFEFYTGKKKDCLESNVHWGKQPGHPSQVMKHKLWKTSEKFNVYAVDWRENKMDFYWNGVLIRRITDKQILKDFNVPMSIIIGNGIDPAPNRGFSDSNLPLTFKVDWVRAYKHN